MDSKVGWEKVRIFLTVGGMFSSGSFRTVRTFFSAFFFSKNVVVRFTFLSTLYGLLLGMVEQDGDPHLAMT